jgi:hypothetical protein
MKYRIIICLLHTCFGPCALSGQTYFEKRFSLSAGGEEVRSFCLTHDGGFAITGVSSNTGNGFILRLDSLGMPLWQKMYSTGSAVDVFSDIVLTSDKGFALCGFGYNNGPSKIIVVKTDSTGNVLWTRIVGNPNDQLYGHAIKETADSNIAVYANFQGSGPPLSVVNLFDQAGNIIWARTFGSGNAAWEGDVIACADKGILSVSGVRLGNSETFIYLVKADSAGSMQWGRIIETNTMGLNSDFGSGVRQTGDGGFMVVGQSENGFGSMDLLLVRLDSAGNALWAKRHGFTPAVMESSIDKTGDRGFIISINSKNPDGGRLVKTDSLGNIQWAKKYGNSSDYLVKVLALPNNSGYAAAGIYSWMANQVWYSDIYFIKTDMAGNTGCNQDLQFTPGSVSLIPDTLEIETLGYPNSVITSAAAVITVTPHTLCMTGHEEMVNPGGLTVFPNPASGSFTLLLEKEPSDGTMLYIYDVFGHLLFQAPITGTRVNIDLSQKAKGVFFIHVSSEEGLLTEKIVVN